MKTKLFKLLPWVALAGLLLAGISFGFVSYNRSNQLTEDPQTRRSALDTLTEIAALQPTTVDDPALRKALEDSLQAPYIATIWLFAPDGEQIAYSAGSTSAASRRSADMEQILAALPQDALQTEQTAMLKAVAAMRYEGEHNDIYRHLILPIRSPDGALIGFLGAAYDINSALSPVTAGYIATLITFIAGLALYWLSLPLWVLWDARNRGERAPAWAVFVLLGNLVALVAYLIVRRSSSK
jgi:hypothetical protein